jgi:hypothetical protein
MAVFGDDENVQNEQTTAQSVETTPAYPAWLAEQQARLAVVSLGPLLCLIVFLKVVRWCVRNKVFRGQ